MITISQLAGSVMLAIGFGGLVGFYIGHRGYQGVKNDLNDVTKDFNDLKAKVKK